jgi:flagellar FliL protein
MPMARRLIIIGAAALIGGVGAASLYLGAGFKPRAATAQAGKATAQAGAARPVAKVAYLDVKEMTLRLADPAAEHYLKITPVLAVTAAEAAEMQDKLPVVRDRIVTIITARSSIELATPEGELKLKKDLIEAFHQDFHDHVVAIYFSAYLVE